MLGHRTGDEVLSFETAEIARLAALDDILAIIHHELTTPLTVMHGYASTLVNSARSLDRSSIIHAADTVQRAALRMDALLSTFKDAREFDRGSMDLQVSDLLVSELIAETVSEIQTLAKHHTLKIFVRDDALLRADRVRIKQVLVNLLINSIKFAPRDTTIDISVQREEENVTVSVTDNGPGIPRDRVGELFQKYARLGSTAPGIGLGLFLSRAIARAHSGDLELGVTDDGSGCRFKLTLPLRHDTVTVVTGEPRN